MSTSSPAGATHRHRHRAERSVVHRRGRRLAGDDSIEGRAGYRNNNIWRTLGSPAPVDVPDSVFEHRGVLPPKGGTVFRVIDIPPEDKDPEVRSATEAVFAAQFADAKHDSSSARHPGMHITDTIDYAIVLQGELVASHGRR